MHLFVRSFVCRFAHSIVRSFMVIHSIVCSFNFVCSFIDPFIYLVIMFLLFLTQVPPVGIILLLDLVLTVSRDFFFSFLYITYTSNKRFDSCSNWNRFFPIFRLPVSLLCSLWSNKSRKMKNSRTNFQWTRLWYCLATISVWVPLNSTCNCSVDIVTRW